MFVIVTFEETGPVSKRSRTIPTITKIEINHSGYGTRNSIDKI
jgi:hypothetical protein